VALVEVTSGHLDDARARLRELAANLDEVSFGATWTAALMALCEVARVTDEPDTARALAERLGPYADRLCVVSLNVSEFGPVSRSLGVLATLEHDYPRAEHHLEDAIRRSREVGARPHSARASVDLARMLLARGAPGDEPRARTLMEVAAATAVELGMAGLLRDIADLDRG
jgi:hypothetical protein